MAEMNPVVYAGVGSGIECLAFPLIALKTWHVIHWPWLWVVTPVWLPSALLVLIMAGYGLAALYRTVRRTA